jgi:hypothetical protein
MSIGASGPTQDLGPAKVTWGTTNFEVYNEVRWTLTGQNAEVFENIYGATPVDTIFLGYSACEVVVPATRLTLAKLNTLLPGGSNSGGASGIVRVNAGIAVGISMYDNGHPLLIQPLENGVASTTKALRLERTYPTPNYDVVFDLSTQRVYGLTFKAHPNSDGVLWQVGAVSTSDYS